MILLQHLFFNVKEWPMCFGNLESSLVVYIIYIYIYIYIVQNNFNKMDNQAAEVVTGQKGVVECQVGKNIM